MVSTRPDARYMARALMVGERGRGRTTPNPVVGAVVVTPDGIVVGQGAHLRAGGPHAEVVALDAAGDRARGATLYCTLEPCSHHGRTPPCVERIVAAGISRVVAAIRDPNPQVCGRGFEFLRARGVSVTEGTCEEAAQEANAPFLTWIASGRPWVVLKAAVSSDGFVGSTDRRRQLTGHAADRYFHRQRAAIDALAVGAATVLVDDPQLTSRLVFRERPLTRVIFDWAWRVSATARVFSTVSEGPVIMVTSRRAAEREAAQVAALERRGVEVAALDRRDVSDVLALLAAREVQSLLVEGGPSLQTAFFQAGLVDRVQWVVTPHVLGTGVVMAAGPWGRMRWGAPRVWVLGADVLVEFDVHGTGGSHGQS